MPFTEQEDGLLANLRSKHNLTWPQIGRRLGRSGDVVRRRYKKIDLDNALMNIAQLYANSEVEDNQSSEPAYDDLVSQWNEWLGRSVQKVKAPKSSSKDSRHVGILSDSHCPYEDRGVLAAFVTDGPYDLAIHGGDLLDWYSVSSFVKRKYVDPRLEIMHGTWVLETMASIATEVEVVSDNHGQRLLKALSRANLPDGLMELLQLFAPELDLFELMAKDLPNVNIADPVEVVEGVHFFGQYGDLVVGHASTTSKLKLRAAENLDGWLREWHKPLGIKPWRVVAQAHTHQLGIAYGSGGHKAYMETGACCTLDAMGYALQGQVGYRPPVPAYTTLTQIRNEAGDWESDFNSIRQVIVY